MDAFSKCHPLTNFLYFLGVIGFTVVVQHPMYLGASCLGAALYLMLLKGKKGAAFILGMIPVFVVLSLVNPLFSINGRTVLFRYFGRPYTWESLCYGMAVAGIFVAMMLWFGCYSEVLTSDKFVCLFGSLIPSLSLLLVMVLRMIPGLMRQAGQISGARMSIGKGIAGDDRLKGKLKNGMSVLSALTDHALDGSVVTADSMRARGYGVGKRTSFRLYRLTVLDVSLIALLLLLAAGTIAAGGMESVFFPRVKLPQPTWGFCLYCLYLLIPSGMHILEVLKWNISISKI